MNKAVLAQNNQLSAVCTVQINLNILFVLYVRSKDLFVS